MYINLHFVESNEVLRGNNLTRSEFKSVIFHVKSAIVNSIQVLNKFVFSYVKSCE